MRPTALFSAVFLLAVPMAQAVEPVKFDAFLKGVESCEMTEPFDRFMKSLGARYGNQAGTTRTIVNAQARVDIPAGLAGGFGKAASANKGEYTEVKIPVAGTYRGLAVSALEFALGNENGISVHTLVFQASRGEIVQKFGAAVDKAAKKGSTITDGAEYSVAIPDGEPGRISCDRST